jgi:hypothetical protein
LLVKFVEWLNLRKKKRLCEKPKAKIHCWAKMREHSLAYFCTYWIFDQLLAG